MPGEYKQGAPLLPKPRGERCLDAPAGWTPPASGDFSVRRLRPLEFCL